MSSFGRHKGGMEQPLEIARNLIIYLKKQPEAGDFLLPVDYKGLNIPWYPTIVKHPMDLTTIQQRIASKKYGKLQEVLKDLQLIWKNCKKVNEDYSVKTI